jgi:hypothetical protein
MRPVRTIIAVVFAAAVAVTGCSTHTTADQPSVPSSAGDRRARSPGDRRLSPPARAQAAHPGPPAADRPYRPSAVSGPGLADGRYDSYIRTVDTNRQRLVVDLVQVFKYPASVDAAIADGLPRDQAQVLDVWVRNQNPRLRTLALASDIQIDLLPGDCIESRNHQLAKLIKDSRAMSNSRPAYYFALTVTGGAIHRIQEDKTFSAC